MKQYGKVAVLMGGSSSEREVSLMSGAGVLSALRSKGVDAHGFDPSEKPLSALKEEGFDCVFNILHGPFGEDGTLQGALEALGMPYTGCGVMASAIAMDKWRTKLLWKGAGLPIPAFELLDENSDFDAIERQLGLPIFVKPSTEGSSIGVTKVKQPGELRAAFEEARKYDKVVIAEQFIGGGEYTCAVIGETAYPTIKIEPATEYYDYQAKYFRDDTVYRCPSGLAPEVEARARELALKAFKVLGCRGWSRVDFLMDEAGEIYLLEANTSPGMTSHSLVPMAARAEGIAYEDLCLKVLDTVHVG
ncbi:D-alanine--D-alanine ligase [Chromobacterium violaceum]|uniref:D-alanine--D-alanine ligase B n=2 Tax=Chromobacterium violaceum TaxID=536 RepID=DDLB_CHRVO|nr:D-alanine--D-alanine ligase [Chromobacterium violaceum]Q7NQ01.1 RecName: Full=D-alanine--D-alanine ligase B; AltName: Full=D-Ala-D-Ala ligase B; AltName: Full=D-alanylalanine synthetase B [Chromobacterium violaceum ATCC 12472]AAQ62000.1 D-alanine--D-alanine ligase [Chromobacterium violaceum ATCC 12472]ATP30505.1 D-alanine--D-alanine ligase B [Chromobacterium violaceum]ATP34413.1 D-alanine--D-alanine ligase B [Chromobacterium violaceum]KJH69210.1 D-alanine--D-alanine ligase [Chromobacterium 